MNDTKTITDNINTNIASVNNTAIISNNKPNIALSITLVSFLTEIIPETLMHV